MRMLIASFLMFFNGTATAYAQGDAEIITNGFAINEAAGIMRITGTMKNNTSVDLDNLRIRLTFRKGNKTVDVLWISVAELKAGEQGTLDTRRPSSSERWNNYQWAFFQGNTPLFWRAPKGITPPKSDDTPKSEPSRPRRRR